MKNLFMIALALLPLNAYADHSVDVIDQAEQIINKVESGQFSDTTLRQATDILRGVNRMLNEQAGPSLGAPLPKIERDSRQIIDLTAEVGPAAMAMGLTTGNRVPHWGLVPVLPLNGRNFLSGATRERDGAGLITDCDRNEVVVGKGSGWTDQAPLLCGKLKNRFHIENFQNIRTPWGYNGHWECPAGMVMVGWNITQYIKCGAIRAD